MKKRFSFFMLRNKINWVCFISVPGRIHDEICIIIQAEQNLCICEQIMNSAKNPEIGVDNHGFIVYNVVKKREREEHKNDERRNAK